MLIQVEMYLFCLLYFFISVVVVVCFVFLISSTKIQFIYNLFTPHLNN